MLTFVSGLNPNSLETQSVERSATADQAGEGAAGESAERYV